VTQLAGFHAPAEAWERHILPSRVEGFRKSWLDELAFSGEIAWGRLWGSGECAARSIPVALLPRADLGTWMSLSDAGDVTDLAGDARAVLDLLEARGPSFQQEIARASGLLPVQLDDALAILAARGLATCDAFAGLRALFRRNDPRMRRARNPPVVAGRWSTFRQPEADAQVVSTPIIESEPIELVARTLLARTGIVFKAVLGRERIPVPWRDLIRCYRRMEARGEIHGGRFVAGFHGEQFALPSAVTRMRALRQRARIEPVNVAASDPLNFVGILTPDKRVAANARRRVDVFPAAG
jgi:ATP-dependent Lhr-like helicase